MRALLLLCCACAGSGGGRLTGRLARPRAPVQHFNLDARAKPCRGGHGVLVEAASSDGTGVLLWLRDDSLSAGEFLLRVATDTTAGRAATGSLRYMTGDIGHGATLDSGLVRVTSGPPRLAGDIVARGVEMAGALHITFDGHFSDIALTSDTTTCSPT